MLVGHIHPDGFIFFRSQAGKKLHHFRKGFSRYHKFKRSECDKIRIEINGPVSPMKLLPAEEEDFLFLVLPVRELVEGCLRFSTVFSRTPEKTGRAIYQIGAMLI